MAHGRNVTEGSDEREKNEAAKLLQQFSSMLRFGKRRLHLRASLTGRPIRIWVTVWVNGVFEAFYVHVRPRCKQAINKVDSPACGQAASG